METNAPKHNLPIGELSFLDQLYGKVSTLQRQQAYSSKGVKRSRYLVYREFVYRLLHTVHDTFPGSDCLRTSEAIRAHFSYCFNQTDEILSKHKFLFGQNQELFDYFLAFYEENLYEGEEDRQRDIEWFDEIFNIDKTTDNNSLRNFICLYGLFDKTIFLGRVL